MKAVLMIVYSAILVLALWFVVASLVALNQNPTAFGLSNLAHSGLFMGLFMCTVLFLQHRGTLRITLIFQVAIVGLLWFFAWVSHAYEDVTLIVGLAHIFAALGLGVWNVKSIRRVRSDG